MRYVFGILFLLTLLQACASGNQAIRQPAASATSLAATSIPTAPPATRADAQIQPRTTASPLPPTPTIQEEYGGCDKLDHPVYPRRLLYPDHADLRQENIADDFTVVRHTTYASPAPPADILAWYREQARADLWEEDEFLSMSSRYIYSANGLCSPAFEMTIAITTDQSLSYVTMDREISGPFSPLDWPED